MQCFKGKPLRITDVLKRHAPEIKSGKLIYAESLISCYPFYLSQLSILVDLPKMRNNPFILVAF